MASKLLPERFGERNQVELTGKDGAPLIPAEPPSSSKMALAIFGTHCDSPEGRAHAKERMASQAAVPAIPPTTLLSAYAAPLPVESETVPVRVEPEPEVVTPAMRRERARYLNIVYGHRSNDY